MSIVCRSVPPLLVILFVVVGCGGIPKDALRMNETTLEDRQLQTRLFDTSDEREILIASNALLQDLGFNLDESETELGLLVASKDRDATEGGQVALALASQLLIGYGAYDTNQKVRVSLVVSPHGETEQRTAVRATFQRIVWNNYGRVAKLERINKPEIYQDFFDKLSKSVFLEAHLYE